MIDEDVTPEDVRNAILAGSMRARQTGDVRGTRYVFRGPGVDGRMLDVVCRLIPRSVHCHGLPDRIGSMGKPRAVRCENCRGRLQRRVVTIDLRRGRTLVVVDHVPAFVCSQCGYKEFAPDVVDRLQRAVRLRGRSRRTVRVPILESDSVA